MCIRDRLIAGIAREGVSVLLISSDMAEMVTLADRILVLHDFEVVGEVANDHRYEPCLLYTSRCV